MMTASSLDVVDLEGFPGGTLGLAVGAHTNVVGGVYPAIKTTVGGGSGSDSAAWSGRKRRMRT